MDKLGSWWQDCFYRTYLALECDFLKGKKFSAELKVSKDKEPAETSHTSPSVMDIVDRSVRDGCADAVSLSVVMLSNPATSASASVWSQLLSP
eukprot:4524258-Alexandrium_andersonii.AAC.1